VTAIKRGKSVSKLQKGHPGKSYKSVWDQISILDNAILVIGATDNYTDGITPSAAKTIICDSCRY
jgi:hypothetical protein